MKKIIAIIISMVICIGVFKIAEPSMGTISVCAFSGASAFNNQPTKYDSLEKTIIIIGNSEGGELFDMITSYDHPQSLSFPRMSKEPPMLAIY